MHLSFVHTSVKESLLPALPTPHTRPQQKCHGTWDSPMLLCLQRPLPVAPPAGTQGIFHSSNCILTLVCNLTTIGEWRA